VSLAPLNGREIYATCSRDGMLVRSSRAFTKLAMSSDRFCSKEESSSLCGSRQNRRLRSRRAQVCAGIRSARGFPESKHRSRERYSRTRAGILKVRGKQQSQTWTKRPLKDMPAQKSRMPRVAQLIPGHDVRFSRGADNRQAAGRTIVRRLDSVCVP
jgi:hypothetical protein